MQKGVNFKVTFLPTNTLPAVPNYFKESLSLINIFKFSIYQGKLNFG